MNHYKCLHMQCRKPFLFIIYFSVSLAFGYIIPDAGKQLHDKGNITEMKKSLIEFKNPSATDNKTILDEIDFDENSTSISDLQNLKDLETETEMNLENAQQNLNNTNIYEHVAHENNKSQRSFVYLPPSKFKISVINSFAPQPKKTKSGYHDISSINGAISELFDDFAIEYYNGDTKNLFENNKKIHLGSPLLPRILLNPLQKEMVTMTKKDKAANGIIHMQYNDINMKNKNKQIENIILNTDPERRYIKGVFKYNKQDNKYFDIKQVSSPNLLKIVEDKLHENSNVTDVKLHAAPDINDRFDYVELIKRPLLRLKVSKGSDNINKHNDVNLGHKFQPYPYGSNLINSRPFNTMKAKFDRQHRNLVPFRNLNSEPFKKNNIFSEDLSSRQNNINTIKSESFGTNVLRKQSLNNLNDKAFADLNIQAYNKLEHLSPSTFSDTTQNNLEAFYQNKCPFRDIQVYQHNGKTKQKSNQNEKNLVKNDFDENYYPTESNSPIKNADIFKEVSEEPEFLNALLLKKIQEIKELDQQLNYENTLKETDGEREGSMGNYFQSDTQDQTAKNVKNRPMAFKNDCVYPDCETFHHRLSRKTSTAGHRQTFQQYSAIKNNMNTRSVLNVNIDRS